MAKRLSKASRGPRRSRRGGKGKAAGDDICTFKPCFGTSKVTASSNMLAGSLFVDGRSSGSCAGTPGASIMNNYLEYRYKALQLEWIPEVGPGVAAAGGKVYVAYIDNPETMNTWIGLTATNALIAIQSIRNVKMFNVWERNTYHAPLTYRRPWFDENYNITDAADVDDRSVQGMIVFAAETVGATDTIGHFRVKSTITMRGYHGSLAT